MRDIQKCHDAPNKSRFTDEMSERYGKNESIGGKVL